MLSLATHEPHFRVLREDVFFQDAKVRSCKLCGQKGHEANACKGEVKQKDGEFDEKDAAMPLKPFIWLHVSVLREYLAVELDVPDLPFRWDIERVIDDWIFLCCFVGNDFLPHLPALEIRENGINTLTALWKDNLPHMNGYVTKDGHVDLERAQYIMSGLAKQEDAIFRRRKQQEDRREANSKRRKLQEQGGGGRGDRHGSSMTNSKSRDQSFVDGPVGLSLQPIASYPSTAQEANTANKSAASVLKSQILGLMSKMQPAGEAEGATPDSSKPQEASPAAPGKRKAELLEEDNTESRPESAPPAAEEGPVDTVRLWEDGYSDRYYEQKFHVDRKDLEFRHEVGRSYTEGLAWVMLYYFQGCPSWDWYYPYHYAPFAADFVDIAKMRLSFEQGRMSKPFEQLMCVLPAASRHAIPEVFHDLMLRADSEIIDFYPEDFEVDLNGKKFAWQGVALLPFIDMPRLLAAIEKRYPLLSPEDQLRNSRGKDVLMMSDAHQALYDEITGNFYSKRQGAPKYKLDPRTSDGLAGKVEKIEDYLPHGALTYPLQRKGLPDIEYDRSLRYVVLSKAPLAKAHRLILPVSQCTLRHAP